MVVLGIDAHKRSHTVVAVDDIGRKLGERTLGTTTADHLVMLTWAEQFGADRLWAVEDCRHLSRRLERDLLGAGERIARVPPKLMAHVRDSARSYGKGVVNLSGGLIDRDVSIWFDRGPSERGAVIERGCGVLPGVSLPSGDHLSLRVAVLPLPAELP
jgi:hypothetical protein